MLLMADNNNAEGLARINTISPLLRPGTIERVFTDCVMDLKQILVLDGIEILPDGFRIRCHDLHGQLPEISIKTAGTLFRIRTG